MIMDRTLPTNSSMMHFVKRPLFMLIEVDHGRNKIAGTLNKVQGKIRPLPL
jgi:hypothetical protein